MDNPTSIEQDLARLLEHSTEPGSFNRVALPELHRLAVRYLNDYDQELALLPEVAGHSHWNLWMWDSDFDHEAFFVVMVVRRGSLEFFCGRGSASAIKAFSGRDFPEDVEQLLPAMRSRFVVPCSSLAVERKSAEQWLGRGLGLTP